MPLGQGTSFLRLPSALMGLGDGNCMGWVPERTRHSPSRACALQAAVICPGSNFQSHRIKGVPQCAKKIHQLNCLCICDQEKSGVWDAPRAPLACLEQLGRHGVQRCASVLQPTSEHNGVCVHCISVLCFFLLLHSSKTISMSAPPLGSPQATKKLAWLKSGSLKNQNTSFHQAMDCADFHVDRMVWKNLGAWENENLFSFSRVT